MRVFISTIIRTALCGYFIFNSANIFAQTPDLGELIGVSSLPSNSEEIYEFPVYPEISTSVSGPFEGDLINDFKFYSTDNTPYVASSILSDGKPALFVTCSFSCYAFRSNVDDLKYLQLHYGDMINIF